MYYCQRKPKNRKNGVGLGTRLIIGVHIDFNQLRVVSSIDTHETLSIICFQDLNFDKDFTAHDEIAHTRWATDGVPNKVNSHPQRSDDNNGEGVGLMSGYVARWEWGGGCDAIMFI